MYNKYIIIHFYIFNHFYIYTNKDNISNEFKKIKMASNITTIGTWNVRSLAKFGKLEELCRELENYKWDIIGLSEVRWKGTGEEVSDNGHTFLYSGQIKKKWCWISNKERNHRLNT